MKGFIELTDKNGRVKMAISVSAIKRIVDNESSVEIITDGYDYITGNETYAEICAKVEVAQAPFPFVSTTPYIDGTTPIIKLLSTDEEKTGGADNE